MDFKGKNALVTGGGRGIGRAIAMELGALGANVAINYASSESEARETADEIEKLGVKALAIKADVSNSEDVKKMFETIASNLGSIDILVNNAGITRDGLLIRMSDEDFDRVIAINLKGSFNCIKYASKYMIKQRYGKIVNIASIAGICGNAGQCNYAASKSGVIGLTKSAAKELAGRHITVNAIAPGIITTSMTDVVPDKIKNEYMDNIPLKRFGKPEDVAHLAAFLCSSDSDYITGQVINIDGGMVM